MERSAGIGALVRRMEGLLEPLEARGDPARFFLATYLRTTRAVAEELERGGFRDPAWVERWDVAFADLYLDAVEDHQAGRRPPEPWAVAFAAGAAADGPARSSSSWPSTASASASRGPDPRVQGLWTTRRNRLVHVLHMHLCCCA